MPPSILIATDADVRGLLACAAAAREHGPGQVLWMPPVADRQLLPACAEAARSQAGMFEHTLLESPESPLPAAAHGERLTRLLLDASLLAIGAGASGVVWAGTTAAGGPDGVDLDALAGLHARAMLVEQLASLEHPGDDQMFRIQAPYADLTDRQLADLVLDMDLPIWTCWWWALGRGPRSGATSELARVEYERWDGLLKEAGWREGMPGPATIG